MEWTPVPWTLPKNTIFGLEWSGVEWSGLQSPGLHLKICTLGVFWRESTGVHWSPYGVQWSPVESIWTMGGTAKYCPTASMTMDGADGGDHHKELEMSASPAPTVCFLFIYYFTFTDHFVLLDYVY